MKTGTALAIGAVVIVCACVVIGGLVLAVSMSSSSSPPKGPYDGLPSVPPQPPAFVQSTGTRKIWEIIMKVLFSVRSECWEFNHFVRVTFINELTVVIKESEEQHRKGIKLTDEQVQEKTLKAVVRLAFKMGSQLDNCPRSTEVTYEWMGKRTKTTVGNLLIGAKA